MNLRNRKLHILTHSPEHSELVQKRLFELGFGWGSNRTKDVQNRTSKSLQVGFFLNNQITYSSQKEWSPEGKCALTVTLDDLYNPENWAAVSVTVKLNREYNAVVSKETVVVGCQTFPLSIIDELVKAQKEVLAS